MNHTERNSFSMQEIEIETLREQIKKEQDKNKLLCKAFTFLQGEVIGKQLNANHPYYQYYLDYLSTINKG
jgi:hypothetical protein